MYQYLLPALVLVTGIRYLVREQIKGGINVLLIKCTYINGLPTNERHQTKMGSYKMKKEQA